MGWSYRRRSSSSSRRKVGPAVNATAWQRKGETMSLSNACATYGVTKEQCQKAELPCQWRSAYGNSYAVVKISDILALKEKLAKDKEEEKKQELIAKHGQEGYERMKKEEEERKQAQEDAAKASLEAKYAQNKIVEQVMTLLSFSKDGSIDAVTNIENVKLTKSAAKSDFFLENCELNQLQGETVGRTTKYSAYDVIRKAEHSPKHRCKSLMSKIQNKPTESRVSLYAGYLKKKLDDEMSKLSKDVVDGAMEQVQTRLQKELKESEAKMKAVEEEFKQKNAKVRSFHDVFQADENRKPAAKKQKTTKTAA